MDIKAIESFSYNQQKLFNFYSTVKHSSKPYVEKHKTDDDPYRICFCKECFDLEVSTKRRSTNTNNVMSRPNIIRVKRYIESNINDELSKLTNNLQNYFTPKKLKWPTIWIYPPNLYFPPHVDRFRELSVIVPISYGLHQIVLYNNDLPVKEINGNCFLEHDDQYVKNVFNYSTTYPSVVDVTNVIHGILTNNKERVLLNYSV